jgi:alginate O-acetyltransferase complex protein AlgI
MTLWPGFDLSRLERRKHTNEDGQSFVPGYTCFWAGVLLLAFCAIGCFSAASSLWLGLLAVLLMLHFGYAVILSCMLRIAGFDVRALFDRPELSTSLQEFWSRRWNVAFVEMNKCMFLPFFSRILNHERAVVAVFLLSGLLHDLAISYPTGSGFGLPFLYFVLQSLGISLERTRIKHALAHPLFGRLWTCLWVLLPLPLVFTTPFRSAFILPLVSTTGHWIAHYPAATILGTAIWLAGVGHFCTLIAGVQMPFRLHWKEELARLSRFNRKIMLNYTAYVGAIVIAFGYLTLKLHDELLAGDKVAMHLAGLIAIFWIGRILVDMFYFKHDDWPKGPEFVIGHAVLDTLFVAMASVYTYIVWINCIAPAMKF